MKSILSTKILSQTQKAPLLNTGVCYEEYDFIQIEPQPFQTALEIENAIFTSQNTVKMLLKKKVKIQKCYCVGVKTKALLEANGYHVETVTEYGKDLAQRIVATASNEKFVFFCGNRRREELPTILTENKVNFEEIQVYKTQLHPQKTKDNYDGILFFSPSGVQSFCQTNTLTNRTAFCIGTTTAKAAEKYTKNIMIAAHTTVESLVERAVANF